MKKIILIILISHLNPDVFAQFENRYWIMGYDNFSGNGFGGFNIDFFNNQPDTSSIDRVLNISQGTSNISSKDGQFLFVTNGLNIGDASNQIMMNGDGLFCQFHCDSSYGSSELQSNIIIPNPGDTNKYYIFHTNGYLYQSSSIAAENYPVNISYTEVDMSLNNGLGAVVYKNYILLTDTFNLGKLTACKHANGRDWWLVFQKYGVPEYFKYLITPSGIQFINRQTMGIGGLMPGYVFFSPNGSHYLSFDFIDGLQVFEFDRCSGSFSNPRYVPYTDTLHWAFGAAFSPSSRYVYTSSTDQIFQFDLQAANLDSSRQLIGIWDGFYDGIPFSSQFYTMSLARDGKIYIICGSSNHYIHRIEYPDSAGVNCHFQQRFVKTPRWYARGIPNVPNYQLAQIPNSSCDTITSIESIKSNFTLEIFPNPVHGNQNISLQFSHVGSENGLVEIINVTGKTVYLSQTSSYSSLHEIYLPDLSQGIYIVRIKFNDYEQNKRLIIE